MVIGRRVGGILGAVVTIEATRVLVKSASKISKDFDKDVKKASLKRRR